LEKNIGNDKKKQAKKYINIQKKIFMNDEKNTKKLQAMKKMYEIYTGNKKNV